MTTLLDQVLAAGESRLPHLIASLKDGGRPVAVYGAGATARRVVAGLASHGVEVAMAVVDRPAPGATVGDVPVRGMDALGGGGPWQVVLGFVPMQRDWRALIGDFENRGVGRLRVLDFSGLSFGAATPDQLREDASGLTATYEALDDDLSRETLLRYLQARLTWDPAVLDGLFRRDQYFPPDVVHLGEAESLVDAGAYDGDTMLDFVRRTGGRYRAIWAFEPDPANYRRVEQAVASHRLDRVHLRPTGTWSHSGTMAFRADDLFASGLDPEGDVQVAVEAIDDVLDGAPATHIKMDVEGAELASVEGAVHTVRTHRPRLAVCLYHHLSDLITIPARVRELLPGARLVLRLHTPFSQELVLYALP